MTDNKMIVYNSTEDLSLAKSYQKSGIFGNTPAEVNLVKIHAGRALGIDPITSMSNIHIVQGKITLGATVVGALIKRSGKYNYKVVEHNNDRCELMFYEYFNGQWVEAGPSIFTMEDAKLAGVHTKDVWKKFPRNMLLARAITNGARWFCPDVFGGPVYTAEELDGNEPQQVLEDSRYDKLTWEQFVAIAKQELNLETEQIQEILKRKYPEYRKSMSAEMFSYLQYEVTVEGEFVDETDLPE